MKIAHLRMLDRTAGVCALAAVSAWVMVGRLCGRRRRPATGEAARILVVKFWGMGSVVLSFDFFQALRQRYPAARIDAVTMRSNRQIFAMAGPFQSVYAIDTSTLWRTVSQGCAAILSLRRQPYDLIFDLEFTSRLSALFVGLLRGKQKIGFRYAGLWRGDCYTDSVLFDERAKLSRSLLSLLRAVTGAIPSR